LFVLVVALDAYAVEREYLPGFPHPWKGFFVHPALWFPLNIVRVAALTILRKLVGESRTTRSGFFEVLDPWEERLVAPGKSPFCRSTSMENDPCLLVKL
jgi:hypothetical protein